MLAGLKSLIRGDGARERLPQLSAQATRGIADRHNPGVRQLVVRLDAPTFERVAATAARAGITTSEAVRQLIRRGLDCNRQGA
jgi:hypothetical protein